LPFSLLFVNVSLNYWLILCLFTTALFSRPEIKQVCNWDLPFSFQFNYEWVKILDICIIVCLGILHVPFSLLNLLLPASVSGGH
jgi:hypothetical protein